MAKYIPHWAWATRAWQSPFRTGFEFTPERFLPQSASEPTSKCRVMPRRVTSIKGSDTLPVGRGTSPRTKRPTVNEYGRSSVLGDVLLSQDPAVQVPSALKGLTVVFGMGTRGSPSPSSPNVNVCTLKTGYESLLNFSCHKHMLTMCVSSRKHFRISPRPISIRQLHTLPCFHPEPINLVVFKGSY